jgi:hypothetical protein
MLHALHDKLLHVVVTRARIVALSHSPNSGNAPANAPFEG